MSKFYFEAKNTKELCRLLGLSETEAPKVEMRRELVVAIKNTINKQNLTHELAAKEANVGRTVITAVVNGNLQKMSTDRLLDIATGLGIRVKLKVA
jgi:predicted XRE-type DNA-binding protein